ncbi:MAG: hypothetical protein ACE10D_03240, partial [Planctomycetota bacterium]
GSCARSIEWYDGDSMMGTTDPQPIREIRQKLNALRRRVRTALTVDGFGWVMGGLFCCVALSFLLDRLFKLEVAARAVLLLSGAGLLGFLVSRFLLKPLHKRTPDDALAIAVEARYPELGDRVISALQLSRTEDPERYGMSPQLIEETVAAAAGLAAQVRTRDLINRSRMARNFAIGAGAVLLLIAASAVFPEPAGIWFKRNVLLQNIRWPQRTYLQVDPELFPDGVARIVRGSDLAVIARSVGEEHPRKVTIHFRDSEGGRGVARMTGTAGTDAPTYRHEFKEVNFPVRFHLEGGDDVTDEFRIELLEPPDAVDVTVLVSFPAYAEREPIEVDLAQGDPQVLPGGSVLVRGRSTKPLKEAFLVLGENEEERISAEVIGSNRFEVGYAPVKSVLAGIRLRDEDGLQNPVPSPRFLIRVVRDRAPRVQMKLRGVGPVVIKTAVIPYLVRMRDDVKVVDGRIEVTKAAADREAPEPLRVPFDKDTLQKDVIELEGALDLGALDLTEGAFLTVRAFASDNAEPESHEGKSEAVILKVVTLEELLSSLLRRQQEQRRMFEELLLRQRRLWDRYKDLRDAPPAVPIETRARLESQAREQRGIARAVASVEHAYDRILQEMRNNDVSEPSRITALQNAVVRAMNRLRTGLMQTEAKAVDALGRRIETTSLRGDVGDEIDTGYDAIVQAMQRILDAMERVEGFTEILESFKAIMSIHDKTYDATYKRWLEAMRAIFGPDFKPGPGLGPDPDEQPPPGGRPPDEQPPK